MQQQKHSKPKAYQIPNQKPPNIKRDIKINFLKITKSQNKTATKKTIIRTYTRKIIEKNHPIFER